MKYEHNKLWAETSSVDTQKFNMRDLSKSCIQGGIYIYITLNNKLGANLPSENKHGRCGNHDVDLVNSSIKTLIIQMSEQPWTHQQLAFSDFDKTKL